MNKGESLALVYEFSHIPKTLEYLKAHPGARVVCLDFWVERELQNRNVPFVSLKELAISERTEEEWWVLAQDIAREWYRLPALQFFEHDGIRIAEAMEPMMEAYLSKLFYYVRVATALKEKYPEADVSIPTPLVGDTSSAGPLSFFEQWAVVDAFRMVGMGGATGAHRTAPRKHAFTRALLKSLLIRAYNAVVGLMPRRSLKIFASEYWSHIAPCIEQMADTELILMESSELKKIPWRQILKHRIRIRHPADATSNVIQKTATAESEKFAEQWQTAKRDVVQYLSAARSDINWSPVLEACEYLVTYSARVIADSDALRLIMREEKPDVVLQRASIGGRQHHFFLMARIAKQLGIPSVELQHAGAYIDPRSVHSRIETGVLAGYGEYTRAAYVKIGYDPARIVPIGSPRFDRCITAGAEASGEGKAIVRQLGLDPNRPILFVAVPASDDFLGAAVFDSFAIGELFEAVRAIQKTPPGMQVLFKFRDYTHVGAARAYLRELFPADMAIAGNEDLFSLLSACDIAVCSNSTVIYEALLAQKPLVLYPWKRFDTYHADMYSPSALLARDAGELGVFIDRIRTDPTYQRACIDRGRQFLEKYSFDGHSSERTEVLVRKKLLRPL